MLEIHYYLGLENEAKNYVSLLGYNYNSSEWYEQSYKILNQEYKINNKKKTKEAKEEGLFEKIIKIIK